MSSQTPSTSCLTYYFDNAFGTLIALIVGLTAIVAFILCFATSMALLFDFINEHGALLGIGLLVGIAAGVVSLLCAMAVIHKLWPRIKAATCKCSERMRTAGQAKASVNPAMTATPANELIWIDTTTPSSRSMDDVTLVDGKTVTVSTFASKV